MEGEHGADAVAVGADVADELDGACVAEAVDDGIERGIGEQGGTRSWKATGSSASVGVGGADRGSGFIRISGW